MINLSKKTAPPDHRPSHRRLNSGTLPSSQLVYSYWHKHTHYRSVDLSIGHFKKHILCHPNRWEWDDKLWQIFDTFLKIRVRLSSSSQESFSPFSYKIILKKLTLNRITWSTTENPSALCRFAETCLAFWWVQANPDQIIKGVKSKSKIKQNKTKQKMLKSEANSNSQ